MTKTGLPGVLALTAMVLTAGCSGASPTPPSATTDGKKIVSSMAAALVNPAGSINQADATCIASRFIDAVGTQKPRDAAVVTDEFAYIPGAAEGSELAAEFGEARTYCLEEKAAASIALAIKSPEGLLPNAEDAQCVARGFAHAVGLDRLVAGQVVDTAFDYLPAGALQDATNARSYGDAVALCLGREDALSQLQKVVEAGYVAKSDPKAAPYVSCFLTPFVDQIGLPGLFANRFVSETGTYSYEGRVYDIADARALAGLILGCVDTVKSDSEAAAANDATIDAVALETCAKAEITPEFLREDFLVNQLLGRVKLAERAAKHSAEVFQRCVDAQKS